MNRKRKKCSSVGNILSFVTREVLPSPSSIPGNQQVQIQSIKGEDRVSLRGLPDCKVPTSWYEQIFKTEEKLPHYEELLKNIENYCQPKMFPSLNNVFEFTQYSLPTDIRVIIVGSEPSMNRVDGLAFSNRNDCVLNFIKELKDSGLIPEHHPPFLNFRSWARQGVLLLNLILTHNGSSLGWQHLTMAILYWLFTNSTHPLVFLLLGQKTRFVKDCLTFNGIRCRDNVKFLQVGHPSSYNVTNPFVGSRCFKQCNDILKVPIRWANK